MIGGVLLLIGGYGAYRYKSPQQSFIAREPIDTSDHVEPVLNHQKDEPLQESVVPFSGLKESFSLDNGLSVKMQEINDNKMNIPDLQNESEEVLLKKNSAYARRDSQGLHLKLSQGSEKLIQDNLSDADVDIGKFQINTFKDFIQNSDFYVIKTDLYEGGFYKLINASTGKEYTTGGYPYFSPDGKYILTAGFDIEAGYSFNGWELFENNQGNLKFLKKYEPSKWGVHTIQWIDSRSARLKASSLEFVDSQMIEKPIYLDIMITEKK